MLHQGNKSQPSLGCLPDTVVHQGNKSQPSFGCLPDTGKQVTTFFWLPSRYSAASRKQVTTFFRVPSRYSGASREQVTNRFMLPSRLPSLECIEIISKYSWCKGCPGPRDKLQTRGEPNIEPLSNYCTKWRTDSREDKISCSGSLHESSLQPRAVS